MEKTCDLTYCALCAGAILERLRAVRRLFGPVRKAKDLDAVHDLRVASRRLRAAIGLNVTVASEGTVFIRRLRAVLPLGSGSEPRLTVTYSFKVPFRSFQ